MFYNEFRNVVDQLLQNNGVELANGFPHDKMVEVIEKVAVEDFRQFFGVWPDEVCFNNEGEMYYRVSLLEFQTLDHDRCLDLALFGCYGRLIVEVNRWESVTFETTKKKIHEFLKLVSIIQQ